jgi:hypothetical protein
MNIEVFDDVSEISDFYKSSSIPSDNLTELREEVYNLDTLK